METLRVQISEVVATNLSRNKSIDKFRIESNARRFPLYGCHQRVSRFFVLV